MIRHNGNAASVVQPWLVASVLVMAGAYAIGTSGGSSSQAKLMPPTGVIGGTMKTLDEIEPRTPVSERFVSSKPGVQFAITEPGSYYLPSDLQAGANQVAIRIEAAPVTLDLMGHSIDGANISSDLVVVNGLADRVVIKNGTLRRSGARGLVSSGDTLLVEMIEVVETRQTGMSIDAGRAATLRDVTVSDAGTGSSGERSGISLLGPGAVRARDIEVTHTGADGIKVSSSTRLTLTDSLVTDTGGDGIDVPSKGIIERVRVERVSQSGIVIGDNCVVKECLIDSVGKDGVWSGSRNRIEDCRIYAYSNEVTALRAGLMIDGDDSIVKNNLVTGGGGSYFGIRLSGDQNLLSCNRNYENLGYSLSSNNMVGNILTSVNAYNANTDPDANFDQ